MPERYRFTVPDGQTHESDAGLAAIRKAHPDAQITHRILLDGDGKFTGTEPFRGKSAEPKAVDAAPVTATASRVEIAAPATMTKSSGAGKKSG